MKTLAILLGLLAVSALGLAQGGPSGRPAYKLDLKIRDSDDQRAQATRAYSFLLDDGVRGQLRVGKKVPQGERNWVDVGVNIDARVQERGGDGALLADVDLDLSSLEGATIHQIKWHGTSRVTAGKPAVIASLQDPVLQKRLDVEITVTRVP